METPSHIGPWRPLRLLGQGAMAAVWLCVDEGGQEAAVKWLHTSSDRMGQRFLREVEVLSRLHHPNIVHLRGRGIEGGRAWLAMDALAGPDLRTYAEKLRRRPPRERAERTIQIAQQLVSALVHLHGEGLVHRDVKPSNVLLDEAGNAVLTDLGIAAWVDEATGSSGLVGTAAYAAPEAIRGEPPGPAVDQYGLGCTLYVLLTGRRPFEGDTGRQLRAHLDEAPRPPSELDPTVPAELDTFVLRLLAKEPAGRFPDLAEAARVLGERPDVGAPLAGRQEAVDTIARALDTVAGGEGVVLRIDGPRGAGRTWAMELARDAAARRDLTCYATEDPGFAAAVAERGEVALLITTVPGPGTPLRLPALGLGDVRRTVYSYAPRTPRFAEQAERLHRLSAGNARMLLTLMRAYTRDEVLDLPEAPVFDAGPWLGGMEPDEGAVAAALAALSEPADVDTLTALAQAPAEEVLPALVERAIAVEAGQGWRLGAEALRQMILDEVPDAEAVLARVADRAAPGRPQADPLRQAARRSLDEGRIADGIAMLEAAPPADPPIEAERVLVLGLLRWQAGDLAGAEEAYARAGTIGAGPAVRARSAIGVGIVALQTGRLQEAIDRFAEGATEASIARDPAREAVAWLDLCEARALAGQLAGALDAGRNAVRLAAGDRAIECAAMRHLGQALLDVGLVDEAYKLLGDATALARALGLEDERIATHALRARATLAARPTDRTAAAAALDRLLPLLTSRAPDPEGFRLLVRAIWARAAAQLGDLRMYARAVGEADPQMVGARVTVRLRAEMELCRAHLLAGDAPAAEARARRVVTEAEAIGAALFVWEARRLLARARREPLPPPGELAFGLDEAAARQLAGR